MFKFQMRTSKLKENIGIFLEIAKNIQKVILKYKNILVDNNRDNSLFIKIKIDITFRMKNEIYFINDSILIKKISS